MPFTTVPGAGSKLRASVLSALMVERTPVSVIKTAATNRASTIVRTADPDLTIALPANSTWLFWLNILLTSAANAAGDFSGVMAWPASATLAFGSWALDPALASLRSADLIADGDARASVSPSNNFDIGCSTVLTSALVYGSLELGATAGSLTLNWAQQTSNVNNTTVNSGSTLMAVRIG